MGIKIFLWLLQFLIWTAYMIVERLSHRDEWAAKLILFFIFLYLAYVLAEYIQGRKRTAAVTTILSLAIFACLQQMVKWFYFW